ncbi:CHAP domain-containing protein [Streptosporangium album]|nr:CHAP domain-containing protein [Streptosporangium album]
MQKFIELLENELGYSEKSGGYTKFGHWYGNHVEFDADYTAAPWCDMYLSWAADKLGYQDWVGQFAYTVHHAEWFKEQGAWGTTPSPGAIVFFDWSGSKKIDNIDHVGIVTKVAGRTIHTIEGNIDGGVAKRKERDTGKVVGYGYPEKIKARMDKEASQKQTVVTADAQSGNSVALTSGPNLLALVPAPDLTREHDTSASRPAAAKARSKHAKPGGEHAASSSGDGKPTPASTPGPGQSAVLPRASADRGATGGKHAKPATADTNALAAAPAALHSDLPPHVPQLGTPAVLAPVLLAAVAIIAHTKVRQSKVRLALAERDAAPARPSRRAPGGRAPGRRAPGRRRITKGAPAPARELRTTREIVPETTLPAATTAWLPSATTTSLPRVEEISGTGFFRTEEIGPVPRRHDGPRVPYQGRRRLRERPAAETSAFVPDAPLRGRRHRRVEPVVSTTIPAGPLPAEPTDVLVHSGYRGRRRARVAV